MEDIKGQAMSMHIVPEAAQRPALWGNPAERHWDRYPTPQPWKPAALRSSPVSISGVAGCCGQSKVFRDDCCIQKRDLVGVAGITGPDCHPRGKANDKPGIPLPCQQEDRAWSRRVALA